MKKLCIAVAIMSLCLVLTGCGKRFTVTNPNPTYRDVQATVTDKTMTCNDKVYDYTVKPVESTYYITVTYEDGVVFTWRPGNSGGYIKEQSSDALRQEAGYLRGFDAAQLINNAIAVKVSREKEHNPDFIYGFLLTLIGVFHAAFPRKVFHLTIGWQYKDLEPTDARLTVTSMSGVLMVIVGLVMMIK